MMNLKLNAYTNKGEQWWSEQEVRVKQFQYAVVLKCLNLSTCLHRNKAATTKLSGLSWRETHEMYRDRQR